MRRSGIVRLSAATAVAAFALTACSSGGTEELEVLEVRYEPIPIEPFTEPRGAEAAPIDSSTRDSSRGD